MENELSNIDYERLGRVIGDEKTLMDCEGRTVGQQFPTWLVFSCRRCGSVVADQLAHDAWHQWSDDRGKS